MNKEKLFLLVMTIFFITFSIDYKPQTVENIPDAYEVIKYMESDLSNYSNNINDFYLLFDSYKLDSRNFVGVFRFFDNPETKILEVYPYINPMYEDILKSVYMIPYNGNNIEKGISNIYKMYMNELEKFRLDDEIDKVLVNGIRIRMIKINTSNSKMKDFLKRYPNVKYSLNSHGLFKKIEL